MGGGGVVQSLNKIKESRYIGYMHHLTTGKVNVTPMAQL